MINNNYSKTKLEPFIISPPLAIQNIIFAAKSERTSARYTKSQQSKGTARYATSLDSYIKFR